MIRRGLSVLDAFFDRLYGWRYNPLYQSGTIAVALFVVLLVTGVYLLLFYRIGDPHGSVVRITEQAWGGRWIRSLHRYASDGALAAVVVHGFRMWVQGRSWGARTRAWISGLLLLAVVFLCGWTGLVMVWDEAALALAAEGARLLDLLPLFSEPIARTFVGERSIPGAFFFMNLFLHIALPIGLALLLWIHLSRLARPVLLPPRTLGWSVVVVLLALSVLWPISAFSPADLFRLPGRVPLDLPYVFWLPLSRALPAWAVWMGGGAIVALLLSVPLLARPADAGRPEPSVVNERLCTGCEQCSLDCPYEAITMIARSDGRAELVARVDPERCVSCGICAGSCAPMGVGPPGRGGRDQLDEIRAFLDREAPGPEEVVIVACREGAGGVGERRRFEGSPVVSVACGGNLHTSVLEFVLRSGAGGVLVVCCPPRDCRGREGPKWLEARIYHDREAELKERVDHRRVRLAYGGRGDPEPVSRELEVLRRTVQALTPPPPEDDPPLDTECEVLEATGEEANR